MLCTALVCFCCPGFFNALACLGGAGSHDTTSSAAANAALYAFFAIFGYLGGAFFNLFGARLLMSVGGLTYAFYAGAAYISGTYPGFSWLFILAGALLGIGASWIWVSQGALMLAYSPEGSTGKYISIFWTIFNMGGLMGGFIQFALNYNETNGDANLASYMVFVGVMVAGSLLAAFCIVDPARVVKDDGTQVVVRPPKTPKEEFQDVLAVIFDRNMLMLFVLFIGSNFFYTYQFDGVNAFMFNLRTRGVNSSLYWGAQMLGAILIGHILDSKNFTAGKRALIGFFTLAAAVNVFYGMGCYLEYGILADYNKSNPLEPKIDFKEARFAFPCIVFILYGFGDAMIQSYAYWIMGAIAKDNTQLCARYTGFYKGVQSLGAAISWLLDISQFNIPYVFQFWCCWILFVAALPTSYVVANGLWRQEEELKVANSRTELESVVTRASPTGEQ